MLSVVPSPERSRRIFYGWWIVSGSMITLVFSCGIGFYSHGAILDPCGSIMDGPRELSHCADYVFCRHRPLGYGGGAGR